MNSAPNSNIENYQMNSQIPLKPISTQQNTYKVSVQELEIVAKDVMKIDDNDEAQNYEKLAGQNPEIMSQ